MESSLSRDRRRASCHWRCHRDGGVRLRAMPPPLGTLGADPGPGCSASAVARPCIRLRVLALTECVTQWQSAAAPCQCQELGRSAGTLRVGESPDSDGAPNRRPGRSIWRRQRAWIARPRTDITFFTSDFQVHRKPDFRPPSRSLHAWHQGQGRGHGVAWPGACTLRGCAFVPQSSDPGGLGCGLFRGPWTVTTALRQQARTRARYAHQI